MSDPGTTRLLHALLGATIYLGPFVLIGWLTRKMLDRRFRGTGLVDLPEVTSRARLSRLCERTRQKIRRVIG